MDFLKQHVKPTVRRPNRWLVIVEGSCRGFCPLNFSGSELAERFIDPPGQRADHLTTGKHLKKDGSMSHLNVLAPK